MLSERCPEKPLLFRMDANLVESLVEIDPNAITEFSPDLLNDLRKPYEIYASGHVSFMDLAVLTFDWCGQMGLACDTYFILNNGEGIAQIAYPNSDNNYSCILVLSNGSLLTLDHSTEKPFLMDGDVVVRAVSWDEIKSKM